MISNENLLKGNSRIEDDTQYGAILKDRWVPAPRYILRRDRVLAAAADLPPGNVLEIGCGSGALLREFARRGHHCCGAETSQVARRMATEMLDAFPPSRIVETVPAEMPADVDLLIACEVLEHIEDDADALTRWVRHLRPGGRLILSVPAHMHKWGIRDIWAGHVRRYSRNELLRLAKKVGLKVDRIECYGFPLTNLTNFLADLSVKEKGRAGGAVSQSQATAASGIDRTVHLSLFGLQTSPIGRLIMKSACFFQRAFLSTDWGEGYLLVATRVNECR